ncbi:serine hydrolase [Nonomuraea sp. NPDC002799]
MNGSLPTAKNTRARTPKALWPVAVTALAATLLAVAATPASATADSTAAPKAAAGQDRPELQGAIQAIVDAGFLGVQTRVNDEQGEWVGSAGRHAHGYFRYQDAGEKWKVIDVTRQNPSMAAGAGDMISTTKDLHTFYSALNSGKLVPAKLLAEMRKPHPKSAGPFGGYGLGTYVQDLDLGPGCGTVLHHNGSTAGGYVAAMYSTPDGKKTWTASITYGDTAPDLAAFAKARDNLLKQVFCDGQAGPADKAKPAR